MGLSAQITLFEDGFETYPNFVIENIGSWTQIDVDGGETWGIDVGDEEDPIPVEFENSGYTGAFIVFNSLATDSLAGTAWAAHTGDKVIACFNSMPPIAPNNDWVNISTNSIRSDWKFIDILGKICSIGLSK